LPYQNRIYDFLEKLQNLRETSKNGLNTDDEKLINSEYIEP